MNNGGSRNGTRAKTVLADVGSVEVGVPRNTASSLKPQIAISTALPRSPYGRGLPRSRNWTRRFLYGAMPLDAVAAPVVGDILEARHRASPRQNYRASLR